MQSLLLIVHTLTAIFLIGLILLQQGKGADVGASFGSGASQTIFGSQGSGSFLVKVTGFLAAIFFISSLSLGYLASHQEKPDPLANLPPTGTQAQIPLSTHSPVDPSVSR